MKNALKSLCVRCKSPELVARTWVEMVETRSGHSKLTYTQIVCSDKICQEEFERKLEEETQKKEELKMRNEAYALKRMVNPKRKQPIIR